MKLYRSAHMSRALRKDSRLVSILLFLALPAIAAPDGGLDVELLDAGTVLPAQEVCMPAADAVRLDVALRGAEAERDSLKTWLVLTPAVAFVVGAVAAGLVVAYVKK